MLSRWPAALVAVSVLLAGCSVSVPSVSDVNLAARSADQLFNDARSYLNSAPFLHERHEYDLSGAHYSQTRDTDRKGNARDVLRTGGTTSEVLFVGGKQWIRADQAYYTKRGRTDKASQKVYPDQWVQTQSGGPWTRGSILIEGGTVFNTLNGNRTDLVKGTMQTVNGEQTVKLYDARVTLYVAYGRQTHLVRAVWSASYTAPNDATSLRDEYSYPGGADLSPPSQFYDGNDMATLPARHEVTRSDHGTCDFSQCQLVATVTNRYGKPTGTSTLTYHVTDADHKEITSCSMALPVLPHGGSQDVSCAVSGPVWADFYSRSDVSVRGFYYVPAIHDPIWDD